jgi:glycosyltransferase involved in cell wall biosynthesis
MSETPLDQGDTAHETAHQTDAMPNLSIVIPCYFSGANLPEIVAALHAELPGFSADYEIILVNDGSTDDTWQHIQEACNADSRVLGINLMRNFGQHNALLAGIRRAQHELVVTMDDDLQHPPSEIPRLMAALTDHDVVYGVPRSEQHGWWRDASSVVAKFTLERLLDVSFASDTSAFRLFRREIVAAFATYVGPFVDIDALLIWGTRRIAAVQVKHSQRKHGTSNYSFAKLVRHAINMATAYSGLPLRLASMIGFVFTLLGIASFGYVVRQFVVYGVVAEGFTFVASIISVFAGAQLFSIGILGEYLARVHFRTMGYPSVVVRTTYQRPRPPSA